jgi:RNA polymerase sigma-70 factor (ECF subfamily)
MPSVLRKIPRHDDVWGACLALAAFLVYWSTLAPSVSWEEDGGELAASDAALADDLVQDCVERALLKSHLYDPARPLRTWLYAVLRNLHVSGLRRQGRANMVKTVDELSGFEGAVSPAQDGQVALSQVAAALDRLPHNQREVIVLVAVEEMSYRDVAEITGVAVGTVMSRLSRARGALRTLLGESSAGLRRVK